MAAKFSFVDNNLRLKLEAVTPRVRAVLIDTVTVLEQELVGRARSKAAAHIHFLGKKAPGSYLASIRGGVSQKKSRIAGYVRSGHPLAHLMEGGATRPVHDIAPQVADILAFTFGIPSLAGIFARHVRQGSTMRPYPAIHAAFDEMRGDILARMTQAVHGAVRAEAGS